MSSNPETTMVDQPSGKRKRQMHLKGHQITTKTIKTPPFSYVHLQLVSDSDNLKDIDSLMVRSHLTAALTQFLGVTGAAISVDILKVEGSECWIRVPREDLSSIVAAIGGWVGSPGYDTAGKVGWNVKGSGNWLSVLVGERGKDGIWNE
jgi:ribonuclease P/MRP protein subunit POP8